MAACATFCLGKGGAGGGESILSGAEEGYPTVFSRLCDCSGEGKGGRWVHLLAPGDGLFADAFFALWPFGEQRGKAVGGLFPTGGRQAEGAVFPLSCPACSFGSHSARDPKGELVGRDPFK